MFLDSYKPRSLKIKKSENKKFFRYCVMFITFIILLIVLLNNKPMHKKSVIDKDLFDGAYNKSENLVRIDKAKLVGTDKKNRPYTITAEKAINEKNEQNIFYLYNVAADISRLNGKWLIINTNKANYYAEKKILASKENVEIFYDDGSSIATNNMKYDFKKGLLSCNDGIVMFGKWGKLIAGNFVYNIDKEVFEFSNKPKIIFK